MSDEEEVDYAVFVLPGGVALTPSGAQYFEMLEGKLVASQAREEELRKHAEDGWTAYKSKNLYPITELEQKLAASQVREEELRAIIETHDGPGYAAEMSALRFSEREYRDKCNELITEREELRTAFDLAMKMDGWYDETNHTHREFNEALLRLRLAPSIAEPEEG